MRNPHRVMNTQYVRAPSFLLPVLINCFACLCLLRVACFHNTVSVFDDGVFALRPSLETSLGFAAATLI